MKAHLPSSNRLGQMMNTLCHFLVLMSLLPMIILFPFSFDYRDMCLAPVVHHSFFVLYKDTFVSLLQCYFYVPITVVIVDILRVH